jgi:uncharacterized protein
MESAKSIAIESVGRALSTPQAQPISVLGVEPLQNFVPSRFNARSVAANGTLILFNSYTGAFSGFPPSIREKVEGLLHRKGCRGRLEGLTQYMYERGYIVPKGTNELQRVRLLHGHAQYRQDHLELILLSSEECNFRCVYCYETFPRGTMEPWVRQSVLTLVARRMPTLNRFNVQYFGGEPLLGLEAIEEMAPEFARLTAEHQVSFSSGMTTNGYLLTPDVVDKLLKWRVANFQISLDGAPEDHDSHRILKGGGPTFSVILANLRAMAQRKDNFSVALRVNFDSESISRIPGFLRTIEDLKRDPRFVLRFYAIGKWGGPNDTSLDTCGLNAEDERQALDVLAAKEGFNAESRMPYMKSRSGMGVCYAARPYNLLIGADGKIMKCTVALDTKDYNIVGHMTRDGRAAIDVDKLGKWIAPYFEDDEACRKCFYVPVCQGCSCPLPRIETGERPCPSEKLQIRRTLISVWEVKQHTANRYNLETRQTERPVQPAAPHMGAEPNAGV